MFKPVTKVVIPAAGLGTRFLPATKAIPKEMLPIVDTPTVQLVIEEAVAAGLREIVLITGHGKTAIEDHFDVAPKLEQELLRRGKDELHEQLRALSSMVNVIAVRQKEPLGLGHAVLCAREVVGDAPFAVMLGDDLIDAPRPGIQQLLDVWQERQQAVVGLLEVPAGEEHLYGVVSGELLRPHLWQVSDMIEKPAPGTAPSRHAIIGRYVLPPEIFGILTQTLPGRGGEIQLTDGLRALARNRAGVLGYELEGTRHDAGDRVGYLVANLAYALKREDLAGPLRQAMRRLLAE
jgi:UTP--glucose-1-phosphate uridylyltransferase